MIDFDLRSTLKEALEEGVELARERDLHLETKVDPSVPTQLTGDERSVRRALKLIVAHALRSGSAELSVYADSLDPELSVLSFEVHDAAAPMARQGAGVPDFGSLSADADSDLVLWAHSTKLFAEELGVLSDPEGGNVYWFRVAMGVRHSADNRPLEVQR